MLLIFSYFLFILRRKSWYFLLSFRFLDQYTFLSMLGKITGITVMFPTVFCFCWMKVPFTNVSPLCVWDYSLYHSQLTWMIRFVIQSIHERPYSVENLWPRDLIRFLENAVNLKSFPTPDLLFPSQLFLFNHYLFPNHKT